MKYIVKILSILFSSLGLFAVALAQSEGISLEVMNLPLLQEPNKTFTFDIALSTQYEGDKQQATLIVDDCGDSLALNYQEKIRMSIPVTLSPKGKQEFPLTLYRESNDECILTFTLLDDENKVLTTTQVGVLPKCSNSQTSIDEGLDYTLPEIQQQENISPSKNGGETKKPIISTSIQPIILDKENSIIYEEKELKAAFDLLVEKGILTEQDKENLKDPLTRIKAAELFVKIWIINDIQRNMNKTCEYKDMDNLTQDQKNIALLACQYGIMGIHPDGTPLEKFMPNEVIPSEQLITAFSRLMWGNLFESNDEHKYFEQHMNHMLEENIIDSVVLHTNQTLADFTIIAARSIDKKHLTIDLSQEQNEKKSFRFW